MNEMLMQDLLDRQKTLLLGKYRGTVVAVDPATMRIQAVVPAALGSVPTGWCLPCVPYAGPNVGFFILPDIGSNVWIEFEQGDVDFPIWTGCFWSAGEIPVGVSATVKSVVTNAGTLSFDNGAGSVTLSDTSQDSLVFDASGATLSAGSGKIEVGASGVSVNSGALQVT